MVTIRPVATLGRLPRAAFLLPLVVVFACGGPPRPRKLHPEFRPERVQPLVVLMDVALVHDVDGEVDELRIHEVLAIAESLGMAATSTLAVKGYRVDRTLLTSMGLFWPPSWKFLTITRAADESLPSAEKPKRNPPFFTNPALSGDAVTLRAFASMYSEVRSSRGRKLEKKPSLLVESAPLVLDYLDARSDADLLVVLVSGRDISAGKRLGNLFLMTLGVAATAAGNPPVVLPLDHGGVMLDAFIVDGRTGELLWSHSKLAEGGPANWLAVRDLANRVLSELPRAVP